MSRIKLTSLIGKLDVDLKKSLESTVGLCVSRTHYNVEVEHWLSTWLSDAKNPFHAACVRSDINVLTLHKLFEQGLNRLKTGNVKAPAISEDIVQWLQQAWLLGSTEYSLSTISIELLLLTLLTNASCQRFVYALSPELKKIDTSILEENLINQLACAHEHTDKETACAAQPALDQFTHNLSEQAREKKLDPVIGREEEILKMINILMRKRQNNPILTGEAGVGKTAVVEGLAQKIEAKDVPQALQNVEIRILDLTLLQAGAGIKGEFENRLKNVIAEVKTAVKPIILFIDEAHNMIGAGGTAGQGDSANLLKPALARGELRTIAATTWAEYKKYFEKDSALSRRFEVVRIEEPDDEKAIAMMRGMSKHLERHHGVKILDEAIEASVRLSRRYLPARLLPDKSLSLLDTASAKVAVHQQGQPKQIKMIAAQLDCLEREITLLQSEKVIGLIHAKKIQHLQKQKTALGILANKLNEQWAQEKELVDAIRTLPCDAVENSPAHKKQAGEYEVFTRKLTKVQGDCPLMHAFVNKRVITEVLSEWTGIPLVKILKKEIKDTLALKNKLSEYVIGQDHAIHLIASQVNIASAHLHDPERPLGVFLLVGSSGIGKTETALALSEILYGNRDNLITINMSEYKEEHKVSLLFGAPPGYIGYGEGGKLTEAVRRKPYSIILLDEIEKAHRGVQEVFFQILDKGFAMDGEGKYIDFRNTYIFMTTNAASLPKQNIQNNHQEIEELISSVKPELLAHFSEAFLGRMHVVPFLPLGEKALEKIALMKIKKIMERIEAQYDVRLHFEKSVLSHIVKNPQNIDIGARKINHVIDSSLLPKLSEKCLEFLSGRKKPREIRVDIDHTSAICFI